MKIGIMYGAYDRHYGKGERALEALRAHGYETFDYQNLCPTETEFFRLPEREFERAILEDRRLAESYGFTFTQSHGPWRWPPQDSTPEELAERFDAMSKAIRGTAYVGAPHFVIHCIMPYGCDSGENRERQLDMNREFFGRLLRVAEEYDVIIDLENLPFPRLPISRTNEVLDFVKDMNSPRMRMCLDTGHCSFYNDSPAESVRMIGKEYLTTLHVHDNDGPHDRHWEPGHGIIDWRAFSQALHDIGYEGSVSLETGVPGGLSDEETTARELALARITRRIADNDWDD